MYWPVIEPHRDYIAAQLEMVVGVTVATIPMGGRKHGRTLVVDVHGSFRRSRW
jgi:hypothetical protein